jgi:asparagine synthase (glutamine-hydrolysing)
MLAAQEMYGPHHGAQWSDGAVALGRRLMRVLPEDTFDRQPLIGARYVLVADVRLDNREELTETLGLPALQARALCDAAIVLAAIERWDESCPEHLIGDYAFAAWDRVRQRLLLARDPLGLRPLHYHHGHSFLALASMPKGLHALSDIPYAADEEQIADFLAGMPEAGTRSFFVGIERVEPGHVVTVTADGLTARRHWEPSRRRIALARPEEYCEALRALLDQAVSCRLRRTGALGAGLSGGLDSGAVAATAARLVATSGQRMFAFTCVPRAGYGGPVPPDTIIDEAHSAAAVAALYPNIEHVLVRNEGRSPLADLDRKFFLAERPSRNIASSGWAHSLNKAVRERRVKVYLTGIHGNLGLSYDGLEFLPELLRSGRWLRLWREASALVAARQRRWRSVAATTFAPWCPSDLWLGINKIAGRVCDICDYTGINRRHLEDPGFIARSKARNHDLTLRPFKNAVALRLHILHGGDPGNATKANLALTQVDSRHPLADVRLLEFCLSVPTEQFLHDGVPRALARRALADRLPSEVLDPTPHGVRPLADWHEDLTASRDGIIEELDRFETCPPVAATLDLPRLRRLAKNLPSNGWERGQVFVAYRYGLMNALAVGHFLRRATGSNC